MQEGATITFVNYDGTELQTNRLAKDATPEYTGATPTKAATAEFTYTFAGWDPEVVAVTGDAEYKATFTAAKNSYTITWKNDDGSVIDTTTVAYGEVPTHADATKAATAEFTYTFAGWTPEVVAVTGNAEYKATFTATKNSYTITWKNDDSSVIDTTTVEYGVVPTHTDATKEATAEFTYTFAGWTPEVVAVTGDATYTATFIETSIASTIRLKYNLSLQDEISIGFLVDEQLPTGTEAGEYTIVVTDESGNILVNKTLNEISVVDGYYSFIAKAFAAKEMTEKVRLVLSHNDAVLKNVECSVQSYCDTVLGGNYSTKLKDLCRFVLAYGAEAQKYFEYKTGDLANANNNDTSGMQSIPDSMRPVVSATTCTGISGTKANLSLVSKTILNFRFTPTSGYDESNYEFIVKKGEADYENTSITKDGDVIVLSIKGIAAKELGDEFAVTIKNKADGTYRSFTGSAMSYVYLSQLGNAIPEALAKALYNYYLAARDYFS